MWWLASASINKLVQAKQATGLHTSSLTQMAVYEIVKDGFLAEHVPRVRALYREQCGHMLNAMRQTFPANASWTKPEGGMFIWVRLPAGIDSAVLFEQAVARNVTFVPGAPFYANEPATGTLRLSLVTVPEAKIRQGIAVWGELIGQSRD